MWLAPRCDDGAGTGTGCTLGRQNFGEHAAFAYARARATGHGFKGGVTRLTHVHKRRIGHLARVGLVQATLIGEDDEGVGLDQVGHQSPQGVVVAKLDFVVDDGVVFVDDRHHTQLEQLEQGGARVEVTLTIGQVGVGEQNLGTAHATSAQLGFVHLHQTHLAHRRCSLQLVQLFGTLRPAQTLHAFGHSARADHDHFATSLHQLCQLLAPVANGLFVQATALVGDQARTHLHHDAAGIAQHMQMVVRGRVHGSPGRSKRGSGSTSVPCSRRCTLCTCSYTCSMSSCVPSRVSAEI